MPHQGWVQTCPPPQELLSPKTTAPCVQHWPSKCLGRLGREGRKDGGNRRQWIKNAFLSLNLCFSIFELLTKTRKAVKMAVLMWQKDEPGLKQRSLPDLEDQLGTLQQSLTRVAKSFPFARKAANLVSLTGNNQRWNFLPYSEKMQNTRSGKGLRNSISFCLLVSCTKIRTIKYHGTLNTAKHYFQLLKAASKFSFSRIWPVLECKNKLIKRKDFTVNGDFTDVEQIII